LSPIVTPLLSRNPGSSLYSLLFFAFFYDDPFFHTFRGSLGVRETFMKEPPFFSLKHKLEEWYGWWNVWRHDGRCMTVWMEIAGSFSR
jgi:hypothetical protein